MSPFPFTVKTPTALPLPHPRRSSLLQVDPLPGTVPVEVAVNSCAAQGAASRGGAERGGAEPAGEEPGGAEREGVEPGGAESEGAESGGAEPLDTTSFGGTRLGGAGVPTGAGGTGGAAAADPGGARTRDPAEPGGAGARVNGAGGAGSGDTGAVGAGAVPTGAGGARARARDTGAVDPGAGGAGGGGAVSGGIGAGGTVRPQMCFVPLLRQPGSCPASPVRAVRTGRRVPRPHPPPVLGTHAMELCPSTVPLHVPLPPPPESSLPAVPDPESDLARAASPTVCHLVATVVTGPSFESTAASALVAELVDFVVACRLDYATTLVAEFEYGDPDAPDIPTPRSYTEAITNPYSSQWQAAMDGEMASWKSIDTYVDEVPPPRANIVAGMWIFRVKRPPGSPPAFKARYVIRGFNQRKGVDFFQTFPPIPKMTIVRVLLHVSAQRDYELHSLEFSTAFLQGSLHEEIWLRRPPGFIGSFPAGTHWSLWRPVYGLRQAPRKWHDTLRTTLTALGFTPLTTDPSLFLRTDTLLPPFYVLVYVDGLVLMRFGFQFSSPQPTPLSTSHSLSAPPSVESIEPSALYPELVGCLITSGIGLVLGGGGPVVLTGHADASWVVDLTTQRSSQGYTFSLGSGSVSWQSTRSSLVLSSSCGAEIYAGAMAAQELRWLTYLLTDLGEQPRSPPVLYVENKAMISLCQEHRLEHRTKHIALR
ncbi:unnamed protein product [Closterium sp. NIES-54]